MLFSVILLLGAVHSILGGLTNIQNLEAQILEMDACPNAEDLPMAQKDVTIIKKGKSYWASGHVEVKKDIGGPIHVKLIAQKCTEVRNPDSCETHMQYEDDGCKQLDKKKGTMYELTVKTNSSITECPITPRKVTFKDMEIHVADEAASIAHSVSEVWYVIIRVKGMVDGEERMAMCTDVWLNVKPEAKEKSTPYKFG